MKNGGKFISKEKVGPLSSRRVGEGAVAEPEGGHGGMLPPQRDFFAKWRLFEKIRR